MVATHPRKEAVTLGLSKYWTGKPCKKGHMSPRYTASGACIACIEGYRNKYKRPVSMTGDGVDLTVRVHRDDAPALGAFVEALNTARALG